MDYSDLPRRPRSSAPAQNGANYAQYDENVLWERIGTEYDDANSYNWNGYANGYGGLTGTGAFQQAPWDDEPQPMPTQRFASTGGFPATDEFAPAGGFAPTGGFPATGEFAPAGGREPTGGFPATGEFAPAGGFPSTRGIPPTGGFPASDAFESTGAFSPTGTFYAADEQDREYAPRPMSRRASNRQGDGGLLAGAVTGFLGAAVAFGVANLIAAFVRPQASPTIAIGDAFITHMPSALKNFALAKSGENHRDMLLLGMYVVIALLAMTIGMVARRQAWACVAAGGLFALFGAYVAINRPESHTADAIPSLVGGIVAIAVTTWLIGAGAQRARRESPLYETDHYISPSYRTGGTV